jgi:hypothetical protein
MKSAIVTLSSDAIVDDDIKTLYPIKTYPVACTLGVAIVSSKADIIFGNRKIGLEWYAVVRITDEKQRTVIINSDGREIAVDDPMFVCQLVSVTPAQKLNPTHRFGKPSMSLGECILIPGSIIATKILTMERAKAAKTE